MRELDRLLNGSNADLALTALEALRHLAQDDSRKVSAAADAVLSTYAEKQARNEPDRLAEQQAEAQRVAAEKAEAERLARGQAEQDRLAHERAEAQRMAAEKAEADRRARAKAAQERLARERAEADRLAAERANAERLSSEQLVMPVVITTAAFALVPAVLDPGMSSTDGPIQALPLALLGMFLAAGAFGFAARQLTVKITWPNIIALTFGWLGGVVAGGVFGFVLVSMLGRSCSFSSGSLCNPIISGIFGLVAGLVNGWVTGTVLKSTEAGLSVRTVALSWALAGALACLYLGVVVNTPSFQESSLGLHFGLAGGFSGALGSWLTFRHIQHVRNAA